MKTFRYLALDRKGTAFWIAFNRPEARNAFHLEMGREILDAVRLGLKSKDVAALILTGCGGTFSAGGDIKLMGEMGGSKKKLSAFFLEISKLLHTAVKEMKASEKPVLAAVPGFAGGVAFGFALGADLRVASEKAQFSAATIRLGLVANGSATYHLPRLVGLGRAAEILFLGDVISAEDALRIGLVNRVVPAADLEKTVQDLAERLADAPRKALGRVKKLLQSSLNSSLAAQLERERQSIAWSSTLPDFQEGVGAFLEKRKPGFNRRFPGA
jgi:2-(1,2-epoxy-1,2-dihydrophenyl)acetyl-CoA isomerase